MTALLVALFALSIAFILVTFHLRSKLAVARIERNHALRQAAIWEASYERQKRIALSFADKVERAVAVSLEKTS